MSLDNEFDTAIADALAPELEKMVKEAQEKGFTPANAVIIVSNDAAPLLGHHLRVLFGAAEVGMLYGYPLVVVSYLENFEITVISTDDFTHTLKVLAGQK